MTTERKIRYHMCCFRQLMGFCAKKNMKKGLLEGMKEPFALDEAYAKALSTGYSGRIEAFKMRFLRQVKEGRFLRIARDQYVSDASGLIKYSWNYSEAVQNIVAEIRECTNDLRLSVFEIRQLNEFVNHLYGLNTVFVSVADHGADFVFSNLQERYLGKVLLRPSVEELYRYQTDGTIVLLDMPTEAPGCSRSRWQSGIEKWLVDLFAEPILKSMVSASELPNVLNGAFGRYAINESALFRYAKRRTVDAVIRDFIAGKTTVKLRTSC